MLGLVSIDAAIIVIMQWALSALALVLLMGTTVVVTGILDLAVAIRRRQRIRGEWLLALTGITSIVFGVLVLLFPGAR